MAIPCTTEILIWILTSSVLNDAGAGAAAVVAAAAAGKKRKDRKSVNSADVCTIAYMHAAVKE